jgi:hypothetical protein
MCLKRDLISLYIFEQLLFPNFDNIFELMITVSYAGNTTSIKNKAVPLHAMKAPGVAYSFLTSALDGGEWSASCPGRALHPGKGPPVPIGQEAGWAPEPVWTQRLDEKSSASVGDRTPVVQSVVRHYTD